MKIIVNAISVEWNEKTISYEDLLMLTQKDGIISMVASYKSDRKGKSPTPGESIDVEEGMIIDVARTDNA